MTAETRTKLCVRWAKRSRARRRARGSRGADGDISLGRRRRTASHHADLGGFGGLALAAVAGGTSGERRGVGRMRCARLAASSRALAGGRAGAGAGDAAGLRARIWDGAANGAAGAAAAPADDGFGAWAPIWACLVTQCGLDPERALAMRVDRAQVLIATHRRNQGWQVAGTPYALRDLEQEAGRG